MNKYFILLFFCANIIFAQQLKVMTYNVRYDNVWDIENSWDLRKNKIVELINYYEPEIIGTQEALKNQIDFLDSNLINYNYVGIGREDGSTKGEYSAIFYDSTKFSMLISSTFWLSETPSKVSVGWDAALERICTFALLLNKISNDSIWVFNTHFDHRGKVARAESAKLIIRNILEVTQNNSIPVILMGDFNSYPDEEHTIEIAGYFNDSWSDSSHCCYGPIGTFNDFNNDQNLTKRIDYIFSKKLIVLKSVHIDDRMNNNKYPSDHLPVMTLFEYDN